MRISLKEQLARAKARLNNTKEHIDLLKLLSMLEKDEKIKIELEESEEAKGFYMPKYKFYTSSYKPATEVELFRIKNEDTYICRLDFSFVFVPDEYGYELPSIEIRCREPGWGKNEKNILVKKCRSEFEKHGNTSVRYDVTHGPKIRDIISFYKKLGVEKDLLKISEILIEHAREEMPEETKWTG